MGLKRVVQVLKQKGVLFVIKKCANRLIKNKYPIYRLIHKRKFPKRNFSHTLDIINFGQMEKQSAPCGIITHINEASADYIGFVPKGTVLDKNAVYRVLELLENAEYDFIYGDNDFIKNGKCENPFFKPDYSPHTLESLWYTQGFEVVRKEKWQNRDYCHKNILEYSINGSSFHISEIISHFKKDVEKINVEENAIGSYLVSIIIPSKDNPTLLKKCLSSVKTDFKFEIIVVDNGSNDENKAKYEELLRGHKYIYGKYDFNFSKMCNIGAAAAKGNILIFMNDDVEAKDGIWLENMVRFAVRDNVGAVGCKLLYPKGKIIQHCGVANFPVGPVHILQYQSDDKDWYFGRNKLPYNTIAVTAACLAVEKSKFDKVEGFDEELPVAYNDVALCFKLMEMGYYNVINPNACLYHHESVSRGDDLKDNDKMQRLMKERKKLYEKFPEFENKDPFYSPKLTYEKTDFDMRL